MAAHDDYLAAKAEMQTQLARLLAVCDGHAGVVNDDLPTCELEGPAFNRMVLDFGAQLHAVCEAARLAHTDAAVVWPFMPTVAE